MRLSTRLPVSLPSIAFGLAILVTVTTGAFVTRDLTALVQSHGQVTNALTVLDTLEEMRTFITAAEAEERGYVITGDDQYLGSYQATLAPGRGITEHLTRLRDLTGDDAAQQQRLDGLIPVLDKRLAIMRDLITLRRDVGFEASRTAFLTNVDRQTSVLLRRLCEEIEAAEKTRLQQLSQAAARTARQTHTAITAAALLSFGLVGGAFCAIRREVTERRRAEAALLVVNRELDDRVAQRTLELTAAKEELDRQLHRLTSLRAIDLAILGATDLRVAIHTVLEEALARLHADAGVVRLFNPITLTLDASASASASVGHRTRHPCPAVRLGEGIAGKAALERRTLAVADITDTNLRRDVQAVAEAEGNRAVYATPLIAKGVLIGTFSVTFRSAFTADPDWMSFFEALAGQAAMAVDSGRSFDDLQRAHLELRVAYDTTLEGWSRALDLRDKATEGHTQRVTALTLQLATMGGLSEVELTRVRWGALLHDIGKMGIPDAILLKAGPLTEEEGAVMRRHPVYAYELLSPIAYLRGALDIPYCHHERWDGTGYPRRLKGDQIPWAARLFAVVDVWDALRSDRPYRQGWGEEKVLDYLQAHAGTHFDPAAVDLLIRFQHETAVQTALSFQSEETVGSIGHARGRDGVA